MALFFAFSKVLDLSNPIVHLAGYYIFSAFAQSLPAPDERSRKAYIFLYRFLNLLGSNLVHAGVINPAPEASSRK